MLLLVAGEKPLTEQEPLHAWILSTMPRALAYATSLVRNRDLAEDVVQDCYYRLLQKASVYDLPRDGLKILLRAITNAAIDLHKRQRVLHSLDGRGGPNGAEVVGHRIEEPVAGAMTRELEQALEAGLARLPLTQRAAFQMKSMGFSLQEIADALTTSVSNASVLVHRARQSLGQFLAPYLEDTAR